MADQKVTIDSKVYPGELTLQDSNINKAKKHRLKYPNIRKKSSLKAWGVSSLFQAASFFSVPQHDFQIRGGRGS